MNTCDSRVFPSVINIQVEGQLAVYLVKKLPLGNREIAATSDLSIKLKRFHLLQVSNTICCLKIRQHLS